eukprot:3862533-Rhodomonas_salina.3
MERIASCAGKAWTEWGRLRDSLPGFCIEEQRHEHEAHYFPRHFHGSVPLRHTQGIGLAHEHQSDPGQSVRKCAVLGAVTHHDEHRVRVRTLAIAPQTGGDENESGRGWAWLGWSSETQPESR